MSKKKKKSRLVYRIFKIFLVLGILGAIGGVGFILYVDKTIVSRLSFAEPAKAPSLYADQYELRAGESVSSSIVLGELKSRGYSEVAGGDYLRSGEYGMLGGKLVVVTREFIDATGTLRPSTKVHLSRARSALTPMTTLVLEPLRIARLGGDGDAGGTEVRASTYVPLAQIPMIAQNAVMAIEDERFYDHKGVDILGIARAMVINLKSLKFVQGGSTLTQQLAKNLLLSPEKTVGRKLLEMAAAIGIERHYPKDKILELYLNEVYIGQEGAYAIHGIPEAAQTFFGKKIEELSIAEAALLAGVIQAPSAYSPKRYLPRAVQRRDLVLAKMLELKFITEPEYILAKESTPTIVSSPEQRSRLAAHYVEIVKKQLAGAVNLDAALRTGLNVYTGLHLGMQECAEHAVDDGLALIEKEHPKLTKKGKRIEAGLVAIEPHSGKIRAWVGGRDFSHNQFDHVLQAKRQVGSTIKPFLYLTALDSSLNTYRAATAMTILPDEPMKFVSDTQPTWEPENYDKKFRGDVTVRYALEHSLNMPAAYIASRIGLSALVHTVKRFHIADQVLAVPSLALGAIDSTLLSVTGAFGALANGGNYVAPRIFNSALDGEGKQIIIQSIIEEHLANEAPVYVVTNMMQGVIERGTATGVRKLGFTRETAGKTGTSNESRDAWFVGFTPNLVAGVWVGYDDNSPIDVTGGQAAVPVWTKFMSCAASYIEDLSFVPPPSVEFIDVDTQSGERATSYCPQEDVVREVFVRGTEPHTLCSLHTPYGVERGSTQEAKNQDSGTPTGAPSKDRRKRGLWDVLFGE